jgi:hypothetical protein
LDRDAVAVFDMSYKVMPIGQTKAMWQDLRKAERRLRRGLIPREPTKMRNPLVP